jgi:salicylate hydroxylase
MIICIFVTRNCCRDLKYILSVACTIKGRDVEISARFKALALQKCGHWHSTLADMIEATPVGLVMGHPAYDRDPLDMFSLRHEFASHRHEQDEAKVIREMNSPACDITKITLLGDAWHPMSPFKGQGANEALLDAVALGNALAKWHQGLSMGCRKVHEKSKYDTVRLSSVGAAFAMYEKEVFPRSTTKVLKSRRAAQYLHSGAALAPGNITRASAAEKFQ